MLGICKLVVAQECTAPARHEPLQVRSAQFHWQADGALQLEGQVELRRGEARLSGTALHHDGRLTRIREVRLTPCPVWSLSAQQLELDHERGWGRARHATLRLWQLPVLWVPRISFPLDDRRKSGFLYPRVDLTGQSGLELRLPYYFNLAPQRDLTLSLRAMSQRGLLSATEYRYLHDTGGGRLYAELLPVDARYEQRLRGRLVAAVHHHRGPLEFSVAADRVTDRRYFSDLGSQLSDSSTRYLQQRAELAYRQGRARGFLRLQEFQSLDAAEAPQGRAPELGVDVVVGQSLRYHLQGRLAHFTGVGSRLELQPSIQWPLHRPGGFLMPQLGVHYTAYSRGGGGMGVPMLQLDSGLFLERRLWQGRWLSLLEPRLHYRYVPYREQQGRPLYDTAALDDSARALFVPNRYAGPDRIADASRLAVAVRSSLYDAAGAEWGNLILGRVYLLRDSVLQGSASSAPWVQALALHRLGAFSLEQEMHLDAGEVSRLDAAVRYRSGAGVAARAGWRWRRGADRVRQGVYSVSGLAWRALRLQARLRHGVAPVRLLEADVGVEYRSCCFSLRFGAGRYRGALERYNTRVYAEFGLETGAILSTE